MGDSGAGEKAGAGESGSYSFWGVIGGATSETGSGTLVLVRGA